MLPRFLVTAVIVLHLTVSALAELLPTEVAILAVRESRDSQSIANYYAERRSIPKSHICVIDCPVGGTLPRQDWELQVQPAIRRWLFDNQLESTIRCFVTVWDVPLKIGRASEESPSIERRATHLNGERRARVTRLNILLQEVSQIAATENQPNATSLPEDSNKDVIQEHLRRVFQAAQARAGQISNAPQAQAALTSLQRNYLSASGLMSAIYQSDQASPTNQLNLDEQQQRQLDIARGRVLGIQEGITALASLEGSVQRDEGILSLLERSGGILGTLDWVDKELELLARNETHASFDSELSLLMWSNYPKLRWCNNMLHHRFDESYQRWLKVTYMVSRLEAPTLRLVRQLIDTSIEVEQTGLTGKVYLDARGLVKDPTKTPQGGTALYDQTFHKLAQLLNQQTNLEIVLDTKSGLFQPGDCPQAALYCGWYSLGKYVDAFDWKKGAIGYHIASSEATTLRKGDSQVWCKRMLEEGVCATLGPAFEPYLGAFPRPDEFFPVLLSGQFTLVETYFRTKPYNSWAMVLVGDPLYNPFRNNPQISKKSLPPQSQRLIDSPLHNKE